MKKGKVLYINKTLNYYRVHGNNATTLNKKQLQFNEIKSIHNYLIKELNIKDDRLEKINDRQEFLKEKWKVK